MAGGRWNSVGTKIVYTASNRSLAMAEVAVHLALTAVPDDFYMLTILVPDDIEKDSVAAEDLPADWQSFPYSRAGQAIGDQFIADDKCCILRVPSAVTPGDFNFLLNPSHEDFGRITIASADEFRFDRRLMGR